MRMRINRRQRSKQALAANNYNNTFSIDALALSDSSMPHPGMYFRAVTIAAPPSQTQKPLPSCGKTKEVVPFARSSHPASSWRTRVQNCSNIVATGYNVKPFANPELSRSNSQPTRLHIS